MACNLSDASTLLSAAQHDTHRSNEGLCSFRHKYTSQFKQQDVIIETKKYHHLLIFYDTAFAFDAVSFNFLLNLITFGSDL